MISVSSYGSPGFVGVERVQHAQADPEARHGVAKLVDCPNPHCRPKVTAATLLRKPFVDSALAALRPCCAVGHIDSRGERLPREHRLVLASGGLRGAGRTATLVSRQPVGRQYPRVKRPEGHP
eukprot:5185807-Prymnesium_polylepis.1